jgi:hypothetical protein
MEKRNLNRAADDSVDPEPPASAEHGSSDPRSGDLPQDREVVAVHWIRFLSRSPFSLSLSLSLSLWWGDWGRIRAEEKK